MRQIFCAMFMVLLIGAVGSAIAGGADVEDVKFERGPDGSYTFHVTVRHGDTGWDHYANKWDVRGPDDTVYGTRVLHHPHENEQPFTRSQSGIEIPAGVKKVIIRAYDSQHGTTGKEITVELP